MSSIKKTLIAQGAKLIADPRVTNLMRDERVLKAVMQVVSAPGKLTSFTQEHASNLAKAMGLATEDEMKDLKRQVRRLEDEVTRLEKGRRP